MKNNDKINHLSNNRIWSGLILLIIGLIFFLKNFGMNVPDWVLSWHLALMAIGLLVGFKRNFQGMGWLIMILIGGYFTLEEIADFDMSKYYFAVAFIALGLYLILKPKGSFNRKNRFRNRFGHNAGEQPDETVLEDEISKAHFDNDILDSVNVFGGSHQNVYSKNFKGGDVVAVFGGCDVNLTQADFKGTITLDIVAIFGGAKIIIPQSWEVKSEVTAIFGGLDDKRALAPVNAEDRKMVIIKGVALFGGVEIRNF